MLKALKHMIIICFFSLFIYSHISANPADAPPTETPQQEAHKEMLWEKIHVMWQKLVNLI